MKLSKSEPPLALIIDGDNLAHAALYSYKRLSYKGKSTSVIFGLPSMLRPLVTQTNADKLIICWDGKKHQKRLELNPKYKSHREEKRDPVLRADYFRQKFAVMRYFKLLGVCQAYDENIEGDDMVYLVNKKMLRKGYNTKIISGDKDMEQLISKYTTVYNHREKLTLVPGKLYEAYRSIKETQIVDYICLTGDDSDDIEGYRGIGPVNAVKFLNQHGSIELFLGSKKTFGSIDKDKLAALYKINKPLIDLAVFNKKYNKGIKATFYKGKFCPKYNELKYLAFCTKYGLKTQLTKQFINTFNNGKS